MGGPKYVGDIVREKINNFIPTCLKIVQNCTYSHEWQWCNCLCLYILTQWWNYTGILYVQYEVL